jgi:hypothetical protein
MKKMCLAFFILLMLLLLINAPYIHIQYKYSQFRIGDDANFVLNAYGSVSHRRTKDTLLVKFDQNGKEVNILSGDEFYLFIFQSGQIWIGITDGKIVSRHLRMLFL